MPGTVLNPKPVVTIQLTWHCCYHPILQRREQRYRECQQCPLSLSYYVQELGLGLPDKIQHWNSTFTGHPVFLFAKLATLAEIHIEHSGYIVSTLYAFICPLKEEGNLGWSVLRQGALPWNYAAPSLMSPPSPHPPIVWPSSRAWRTQDDTVYTHWQITDDQWP